MRIIAEDYEVSSTQIVSILDSILESVRTTIDYSDTFPYDIVITVDLAKHKNQSQIVPPENFYNFKKEGDSE